MVSRLSTPATMRFFAVAVLLAAVMPNALYVGHWEAPEAGHTHGAEAPSPNTNEHALHCHGAPSSCAGAQSMAGALWAGEDAGLLSFDGAESRLDSARVLILFEAPAARLLQPPRADVS